MQVSYAYWHEAGYIKGLKKMWDVGGHFCGMMGCFMENHISFTVGKIREIDGFFENLGFQQKPRLFSHDLLFHGFRKLLVSTNINDIFHVYLHLHISR